MAFSIDYEPAWEDRLVGRLYAEYRDKITWQILARMFGHQAQDTEDAGQTLLTIISIDDSQGVQLDTLGAIVGEIRAAGLEDEDYRPRIRARIRANQSEGTAEDLYAVFLALLGLDTSMAIETQAIAEFVLTIRTPITAEQALVVLAFLEDAKDTARRGILIWQQRPSSEIFTCGRCAYVRTAAAPTDTTLEVEDAGVDAFPPSGTVTIDFGLPTEETIAYNSIGPGPVLNLAAGLANAHDVGADVHSSTEPGKGFPVDTAVDSAASPTDTTLTVVDTSAFSGAGVLVIDEGLPTGEEVGYTTSGGTTFALATGLVNAHDVGAPVVEKGTGGAFVGDAVAETHTT